MSESADKFWSTMGGVLVGAAIGAGAMYFLAPRSGKENRQMVKDKYNELTDYITDETEAVVSKVQEIFGDVNEIRVALFTDAKNLWNTQVATFEKSMEKIDKNRYQDMVDGVMEKLQNSKRYPTSDLAKMKRYLAGEWKKFTQMMD